MLELCAGLVIHSRPFRDSSLIVESFTREYGRVPMVAKGVTGSSKRNQLRRAALQPFNTVAFRWTGRGDLKTLTDVEMLESRQLQGAFLFAGLYLNELLERLLPRDDPQPNLFTAYLTALVALQQQSPLEPELRQFEWLLLAELGYALALDEDVQGQPLSAEASYAFFPEQGLQRSARGIAGEALMAAARGEWNAESLRAAKQVNRAALAVLLGSAPLRSRALFTS